ncbi:3-keto-disaccharide hydrolase [Reichenbachiella versicolor]|uniref:3-keto-disaccharide hydrolase n=1 Tax=Reichenbachiella versicolor TaxID=1821036 RepID=UPI000D6E35AF|nr:DUF1080 domain-containing protein [Reichenbachiella versicolor]
MRRIFVIVLLVIAQNAFAQKSWTPMLDKDLSKWELFMGVPHTTVQGLDVPQSDDIRKGTPLGLGNDPKNVFSVIEVDGEIQLYITGEIYGGLTTLAEYSDYHLKAEFKWGEKKWAPRLDKLRDNGILYHCQGKHGAFWNVWMKSLEFQVQETDCGDFITLLGTLGDLKVKYKPKENGKKYAYFHPDGELKSLSWVEHLEYPDQVEKPSFEKPNGEWNTLEVLTIGQTSIHVVNGIVVNAATNTRMKVDGEELPLSSGKIQLQSEGAECYYRNIQMKSIKKFPKSYVKQAKL